MRRADPRNTGCYTAGVESFRRCLHRWTWIALVAVLGVALAPTLSHATAGTAVGHPWAELCTSGQGQPAPQAGDVAEHGHADHCALCAQLGAAPLPSMAAAGVSAAFERIGAPAFPSPFARLPWRAAQPRGPPTLA